MKDNFDLRKYLIENKMTENSRGDKRHHLTEAVYLNTKILGEGYEGGDLDLDSLDNLDSEEARRAYDAAMQDMGMGNDFFDNSDEANLGSEGDTDEESLEFQDPEDFEEDEFGDKNLEECGDMDMELDEASYVDDDDIDDYERDLDFEAGDALAARIGGQNYARGDADAYLQAKTADQDDYEARMAKKSKKPKPGEEDDEEKKKKQQPGGEEEQDIDSDVDDSSADMSNPDYQDVLGPWALDGIDSKGNYIWHRYGNIGTYKPGNWVGLLKYLVGSRVVNWNCVNLDMTDGELNDYLGKFSIPGAACVSLSNGLKRAQREVNDSGLKKIYLMRNLTGGYKTGAFKGDIESGRFIGTIRRDPSATDYYDPS